MLFTIAIPTYNSSKTLGKCLESCVSQNYEKEDYEILVINNNSNDQTKLIINQFKDETNLRSFTNKETVSMYMNHNIALQKSKGNYILFCHSDDYLEKNALCILHNHLKLREFPPKYICWGHSLYRDFNYYLHNNNLLKKNSFSGMHAILCFINAGITPSGTCYSKDIYEYGGFLTSSNPIAPCDSSSMVYLSVKGFTFSILPNLIFFRESSQSYSNLTLKERYKGYRKTYEDLFTKIGNNYKMTIWSQVQNLDKPPYYFIEFISYEFPNMVFIYMLKLFLKFPYLIITKKFIFQLKNLFLIILKIIK